MGKYPPLQDVFRPTSPSLVALTKPAVVPHGPPTEEELRESEVHLQAVAYYHFCWAILRERLRLLEPQPFELRRAVELAAVVCHLAHRLRPHRILQLLNIQSDEFLGEALDEAVNGTFSRPFRKERWRARKPYLDEIADPVRNLDGREVLTELNRGFLQHNAHDIAKGDPERDRPLDAELEQFIKVARRVQNHIEDELTRSLHPANGHGDWAKGFLEGLQVQLRSEDLPDLLLSKDDEELSEAEGRRQRGREDAARYAAPEVARRKEAAAAEVDQFLVEAEEARIRALADLTSAEEHVWVLHYDEELTAKEIGERRGTEPETVHVQLSAARKKMRAAYRQLEAAR